MRISPLTRRISPVHFIAPVVLSLTAASQLSAATYFWDADAEGSAATGGAGTWDTTSALWRFGSPTGALSTWPTQGSNHDAFLGGTAGTLTLASAVRVNDIEVTPSPAGTYAIAGPSQTLTFNGAAASVVTVGTGSTLAITSGLVGYNGFNKEGTGTLVLDGTLGSNGLVGAVAVNAGTLQAGSVSNGAAVRYCGRTR
jgi:autotransporter-associated beta strand protein